jgi:4-hydroxybenzoate polyprenyltransferase
LAAAGSLRFLKSGLALLRWDKPSGRLILLIPAGWSLWLLPTSPPDPLLVALIGLGGLAVSGAGCVANDLWDRRIDPLVERTRLRPLASGAIGVAAAAALLLLCLVLALGVVLALPAASRGLCLVLALAALPPVLLYPSAKRWFALPQLVLALCPGQPGRRLAPGPGLAGHPALVFRLRHRLCHGRPAGRPGPGHPQ